MSTPKFRLLLHGHDGSVPYLTPELMRLVFCPNANDGTRSADSSPDSDDDDWKWRRQHFILGVAVKDTCVTAVYREASSVKTTKKRKKNGGGVPPGNDGQAAKRAKTELKSGDSVSEDVSTAQTSDVASTAASTSKTTTANDEANTKKPAGYTFLTPSKSSQICSGINSHNNIDQQQNKNDASTTSSDNKNGSKQNNNSSFTNFMQTHLRIPSYISTMIVPTFALDYPETTTSIDDETDDDEKKYIPKVKVVNPAANKQQKQQKNNKKDGVTVVVIPNSTKDTMPLDTPHGWQKLQPDRYWDAVTSLTTTLTSATCSTSSSSNTAGNVCQGVVGLFDHMGIPRNVLNYLFAEFAKKHGKEDGDHDNIIQPLAPQAQALVSEMTEPPISSNKWNTALQRLVQRTNDWSNRTQSYSKQQQQHQQSVSMNFWTPVHLAASHLTLDALLACPRVRVAKSTPKGNDDDTLQQQQKEVAVVVPTYSNVAIVGWNSISYNREYRCQALQRLMTTMQQPSSPTTPTPTSASQYLILSVNDLPSILDAAKAGVSIIGTDLVRQWSCSGRAICLDLSFEGSDDENDAGNDVAAGDDTTKGAEMDLKNEQYAQDSLPLLPGCKCIACRPRRKSTGYHSFATTASQESTSSSAVPSFTRAYIHHLLKAKEMSARTLLFLHNLHQVLLLFRQLSEAAVLDDGTHYLNALCGKIKGHLP